MTPGRRVVLGSAVAAVCMVALPGCDRVSAVWSGLVGSKGPTFNATDITGSEFARTLSLPDVEGRQRTLADWKGKVVFVFFGYTQCPDVCPATMAEIAEVRKSLGADADKLQTVFVTIDPERDTPEILKAYVGNFGPDVVALRGTPEQTAAAAKEFKVFYAKVAGKTPGSYTMDHTAASFVFDTHGKPRLFVAYGGDSQKLAADIKTLLAA